MEEELQKLREEFDEKYKKMSNDIKKLQKALKVMKNEESGESKPRRQYGFEKPTKVSKELAKFLGITEDEMIARTDVTKRIHAYVKDNNLQNPSNGREYTIDKKLAEIITVQGDEKVTILNLQKYLKHHYVKSAPSVETVVVPELEKVEVKTEPVTKSEESKPKVKRIIRKVVVKKN